MIPMSIVDAFTAEPFAGNPAAVCFPDSPRDDAWLQQVAREMNLSETAFLWPIDNGYQLRWFTPTVEVDLCGHATLASAHILWETGRLARNEQARFSTRSGWLTARSDGAWITMDFPAEPVTSAKILPELADGLGVPIRYCGRNRMDYLVEVDTEETVRTLHPNLSLLAQLPVRGVIVTSAATTSPYDFVSRFFAPAAGIPEDPVTGSAHCALAPYWSNRLGKDTMLAAQVSQRGGIIRTHLNVDRVEIGGQAVTVLQGELRTSTSR
ncbi:MAG TPA: PhzF family phenazine biosynthesis protein [Armatimonadota bacterium]|nr:PhzF family phenazine biosynthesis protein [Armatimonadota bacterium]